MADDPQFAAEVRTIAQEIHAGNLQDNSTMTQMNQDNARGWQTKVEGQTAQLSDHPVTRGTIQQLSQGQ